MDAEEKIQHWIDGLAQFDLWQSVCDFYKENEEELVEMNKEQLRQCKTSDGRTTYGISGEPRQFYNLGNFYAGITITTDADKIEFVSTDPKWSQNVPPSPGWDVTMAPLLEWFGLSMLGIPDDKEQEVDERRNTSVSEQFRNIFN